MRDNNRRSLGLGHSSGFCNRVHKLSFSGEGTKRDKDVIRTRSNSRQRNSFTNCKKYDRRSGGIGKVFCKQFVFGGKEGQRVASSDKSQRAKQVLNVSSFQNGGNPLPKGFIDGEGLDGKVGSQGCILYNSHGKGESKMLAI